MLRELNTQHQQDELQANEHMENWVLKGMVDFGLYRVVVLLWMLLGLSWLGGMIQIAVDVLFNQRKGSSKKRDTSLVVKDIVLIDQDTQTSQNDCTLYSVSL